jgi:hypothetical protein
MAVLSRFLSQAEVYLKEESHHKIMEEIFSRKVEKCDDFVDDRGLNAFGRLVEQDQAGFAAQATRDRQQLLFAA